MYIVHAILLSTQLMHLSPLIFTFFFFGFWWEHQFCLSKFQLYNMELSNIVTMLYIKSSDLTHLIMESLYTLFIIDDFGLRTCHWPSWDVLRCVLPSETLLSISLPFPSPSQASGLKALLPSPASCSCFLTGTPCTESPAHLILPSQRAWKNTSGVRQADGAWGLSHSPFSWQTESHPEWYTEQR